MKTSLVRVPNNCVETVAKFLGERKVKALVWEEIKAALTPLQDAPCSSNPSQIRNALRKIPGANVSVSRVPLGFEVTLYGPYNTGYAEAVTFTAPHTGALVPYVEVLESLNWKLVKAMNSAPQMMTELADFQEKLNAYKASLAAAEESFKALGDFGYLVQMSSMIATEEDFCN